MKNMSVFALVMFNVIAVASLRNITLGLQYGLSIVFFYLLVGVVFFVPSALISAELASTWPVHGGVYVWAKAAFGQRIGLFVIWLQWIYNLVWYPTMFIFLAGVVAALYDPALIDNKLYMFIATLSAFWLITVLNFFGMQVTNVISTLGAIVGTIVPMLVIAGLGVALLCSGKGNYYTYRDLWPHQINITDIGGLLNILFSLMGIELSAVYAAECRNKHNYALALAYAVPIIFLALLGAVLAINIAIPNNDSNMVGGVVVALRSFCAVYNLSWLYPILVFMIIIGGFGSASAWLISSARSLLVASAECHLPKILLLCNKHNMPTGIMIMQGIVVSCLAVLLLFMHTVQSAFCWLSNLTAQLALLYYIILFAAAIKSRYQNHQSGNGSFKIPGGLLGIWLVGGLGIMACIIAMLCGFIVPPGQEYADIKDQMLLIVGVLVFCMPALLWPIRQSSQ